MLSEGPKEGPIKGGCYLTYDKSVLPHAKAVYFEYTALNREEMPWQHYRFVLAVVTKNRTMQLCAKSFIHFFSLLRAISGEK